MFSESFITDCEGPLTLNDNAYELCDHFIENGGNLFKILSAYDDYLADVVKLPGYKSGNTLILILPFLIAEGIKNKDLVEYSKNVTLVPGSEFLIKFLKPRMNNYIISTSYGQYIEALCANINFSFENTFYTNVDIDEMVPTDKDVELINGFKEAILKHPENYVLMDEIFFEKMSQISFDEKLNEVEVVGGVGKKYAILKIISRDDINMDKIFYIGDSITDVDCLKFASALKGISVSFNGNSYPIDVADIAIVSPDATATALIASVYYHNPSQEKVFEFINKYNEVDDLKELFKEYKVDKKVFDEFFKVFDNKLPIIKLINKNNREEILEASVKMRNVIRGKDIGGLG